MSTTSDDPAGALSDDLPVAQPFPPPDARPTSLPPHAAARAAQGPEAQWQEIQDVAAPEPVAPIRARPGDLTPTWRFVLAAAWVAAFFAYAAVWQASVQIGIGTWWIGPRAQPTPTVVRILPSVLSIALAICVVYNVPRVLRLSAFAVGLATVGAIPDLSRSVGLGVAELVIAGLLGLVTVAAVTGRYRLEVAAQPTSNPPGGPIAGVTGDPGSDSEHRVAMALFAPPDPDGS
jgi:hypothetical protein